MIFCVPFTQSSIYMDDRVCTLSVAKKCFRVRPVLPDYDVAAAGQLRLDRLPRQRTPESTQSFHSQRRRGFFSPVVVRAERTVHVVATGHAGRDPKVFSEVAAPPLAKQFLPAASVFGRDRRKSDKRREPNWF